MAEQANVKVAKVTGRNRGRSPGPTKSLSDYAELGPEQTIEQMAARHRARVAADSVEKPTYADIDLPFVDDGADW
jgi:hypothetical protein